MVNSFAQFTIASVLHAIITKKPIVRVFTILLFDNILYVKEVTFTCL